MNYFPITFVLLLVIISSVINRSHSFGVISQILENSGLHPGRSTNPQQSNPHLPDQTSTKNLNRNNAFFHIDENVVLKSNDLLTCKILKTNEENNIAEFKVNTPPLSGNSIFYTYLPVPSGERCFSIKIRAEKYAYVALSENPYKGGRLYDIILGATGPIMKSGIRKNLAEEVVKVPTPNIINGKEFRDFIITWINGEIKIMRDGDLSPFMYYHEPNMYPVNYIGIATYDNPGTWIVGGKGCTNINKAIDLDNFATECWLQPKTEKNTQFDNLIQLQKYFLKQMTNDYENFNKSLNQENDKEFIEIYKNELKDNYNKAKEIQNEIILNKIKSDIKEELTSYNVAEKTFEEIRQLFFQYYRNLQILLTNLNTSNNVIGNLDSKCNAIVKNPSQETENMKLISSTDEFYEITTVGCFTFKVHRSAGYIRISLTNGYKKSLSALIAIGKNSEIQTWKDFQHFDNLKLSTPSFENRAEYQSYWISWNAQRILVGKDDNTEGFMSTYHAIDYTDLKYVNVITEHDGERQWEKEELQCPHDFDIRIGGDDE